MRQPEFIPDDFSRILRTIFDEMVQKYSGGCEVTAQKCAQTGATFSICRLRGSGAYYPDRLSGQVARVLIRESEPWYSVFYLSMYSWAGDGNGGVIVPPDVLVQIHLKVSGWDDSPSMTRELFARDRDGRMFPHGIDLRTNNLQENKLVHEIMRRAVELAAPFPTFYKQEAAAVA